MPAAPTNSLAATLIPLCGLYALAFALFHAAFWKLFRWRAELPRLGPANRGIVPVLNLALTAFFCIVGAGFVLYAADVASTALGRYLLLAMTAFWLARALVQAPYFGLRHPLSWGLLVVFLLGAALHAAAWRATAG